jgi:hypothetical protein
MGIAGANDENPVGIFFFFFFFFDGEKSVGSEVVKSRTINEVGEKKAL